MIISPSDLYEFLKSAHLVILRSTSHPDVIAEYVDWDDHKNALRIGSIDIGDIVVSDAENVGVTMGGGFTVRSFCGSIHAYTRKPYHVD